MTANTARPAWPNHVSPATAARRTRASGTRTPPSDGWYAMTAEAAAATLIAIVRA